MAKAPKKDCFVIMPIADADGYTEGHFGHVYENIIKPSCTNAGFDPVRADEVKETNLIHLDILKKLIEAPIAICDLSNRNPNVLFELGIRQAFDKPVVLIQEIGTPKIFDIAPLRYLEYSKEMKYHDVLNIQEKLKEAILATEKAEGDSSNINSIVKLLALNSSAQIPELGNGKEELAFDVLHAEMREMRKIVEVLSMQSDKTLSGGSLEAMEYDRLMSKFKNLNRMRNRTSSEEWYHEMSHLRDEIEEMSMSAKNEAEHRIFRRFQKDVDKALHRV